MESGDQDQFEEFRIPDDTLGLHTLRDPTLAPSEIEVDVVAVHGLGGDSFSTWTHKDSGRLWLRDFLPKSPWFKNARILTYGYDARVFIKPLEQASAGRLFTIGESLLSNLDDGRVLTGSRKRPLIFVAHSLGGLVIKSALVHAKAKLSLYGDLLGSTKAIIFFGTPHAGADVATWSTNLGKLSQAIGFKQTAFTKELQRWSTPLLELSTLFSEQLPDFLITTFFEKYALHGVVVVSEGSARLNQRNEVATGLDADHRSICKYESEQSAVYRTVKTRFEATMAQIRESK